MLLLMITSERISKAHCLSVFLIASSYSKAVAMTIFQNESNGSFLASQDPLSMTLTNLFRLQAIHWSKMWSSHSAFPEVVIIFQQQTWRQAVNFQLAVSEVQPTILFMLLCLTTPQQDVATVLHELRGHSSSTSTVFLFVNNSRWIDKLFQSLCKTIGFKWTALRHMTEWVVVSSNVDMLSEFKTRDSCIDFITLMIQIKDEIIMARKSRGGKKSLLKKQVRCSSWACKEVLAACFKDLARKRKSSLEGMHLPVAILTNDLTYSWLRQEGNTTSLDGYSVALLKVMASYLGFTFSFKTPTDNGDYGAVKSDGTVTGVAGLLARREAAITTMSMSKTKSRLKVIDFVDCPTSQDPLSITYKLPMTNATIDTTLLGIVHVELVLSVLGPAVVMLVVGGFLHVATKSCSEVTPKFKMQKLRLLGTFPDHICFQSPTSYAGQTGRILRASWGVFWVTISAAYGAYLVTTFTVKEPELKINTLDKLLNSSYRIGIPRFTSAFLYHVQTSTDPEVQELWRRVLVYNKSDPLTLSSDITQHILRVLAGDYAIIAGLDIDLLPDYLQGNPTELDPFSDDIRCYEVRSLNSLDLDLINGFVAMPNNTFYKSEVNAAILWIEASGVLSFIRRTYLQRPTWKRSSAIKSHKSVSLSRILLLVYATLAGIALALICLALELIYVWCKRQLARSSEHKTE